VGSLMSPVEITLLVSSRCTARGSVRSTWIGVAQAASVLHRQDLAAAKTADDRAYNSGIRECRS
jgi:hypothetical protein